MAIFRVQLFKQKGTDRPWTNVYHVDAADIDAAAGAVVTVLAPAESHILADSCNIIKAIVSDPDAGTFITLALSVAGLISDPGLLPLFNTMRAIVAVGGLGRNDSKFYRGYLGEGNTENQQISSGAATGATSVLNALVSDMATAGAALVDEDGNSWGTVTIQLPIQERQRHRRRKRV
jgi:hypothetical protein